VGPGAFAAAVAEARIAARAAGRELVDLTVSNPTVCGFRYDAEAVLGALGGFDNAERGLNDAMVYDPDPRGMRSAREAVAGYYADHAASVDPDAVVLTTSTSEAYSYLFRLLCDAGDEVLVPVPSYPLFEFLADLDDVRLRPYTLFYDYGWWIDLAELERRIGPKTRAVIVVHPNNPTGHWTHRAERERLEEICARRGVALIVDEVFLDYPVAGAQAAESFAVGPHPALTFVLSGISKIAALPQMKVAWLASCGPEAAVGEAMARLEVIADTFLSMNAPVQLALPQWLSGCGALQRQIRERVVGNLDVLRQSGLEVLRVEAGWSAVVRLRGEDAGAMRLMREQGVVAHPGEFYGLADKRMVVLSLITPGEVFAEGIGRMALSAIA
jgi:aspartate/methionine/tyrosine aminotransferase